MPPAAKTSADGDDIVVRVGLEPGDLGYLVYLHGALYAEEWGFDHTFEPYVAAPMAEFVRKNSSRERIWIVEGAGTVAGSVAVVENSAEMAQLRWLILHPSVRGHGLGRRLVKEALDFAREAGYSSMCLWTVADLGAAKALYESFGFALTEEQSHPLWGREIVEQRFDLDF